MLFQYCIAWGKFVWFRLLVQNFMETLWLNEFQDSNFNRLGVVFMCFNSSCDQTIIEKKFLIILMVWLWEKWATHLCFNLARASYSTNHKPRWILFHIPFGGRIDWISKILMFWHALWTPFFFYVNIDIGKIRRFETMHSNESNSPSFGFISLHHQDQSELLI